LPTALSPATEPGTATAAAADAGPEGGVDAYLQVLFPPGSEAIELPGLRSATLYVTAGGGVAQRWRATAMYPGNRPAARILRGLARGVGCLGLSRARRVAGGDDWPLGGFLREALPDAAEVSVLLKLADTTPRATVEIRNAAGCVLGYAKYAVRRNAILRLERERDVLASGLPRGAPEVVKFGPLGNGKVLLLSPLPGRRFWAVLPPPPGLIAFVGRQTASPPVPLSQHPWVAQMRQATSGESDALFAELDAWSWPIVVHHGDLMPSNLCIGPDGEFAAVDWEYGTCTGFPHLDLLQYMLLILAVLRRTPAPAAARRAAAWLASQTGFGISSNVACVLTRLAALDLWVNGRNDGEREDAPGQILWRAIAAGGW
jgi:hypothetical protein